MKKILVLLLCCLVLTGCEKSEIQNQTDIETDFDIQRESKTEEKKPSQEDKEFPTSEQLLLALKSKNENLIDVDIFDQNTDPNRNLGRPGYYITKADFSDSRVEQIGEYLCGGTIETFSNKEDCKKRAEHLNKMNDPSMGALGVNQYIYEYDLAVFRVTYDLNPEQSEEYDKQMTEIIAQWEETGKISIMDEIDKTQNTINNSMDKYKKELMNNTKDIEVSYENSDIFFEIAVKSSDVVSNLTSDKIIDDELFNDFSLSAGYLCNNFDEGTDYRKAGELAFELIKCIVTDDIQGKQTLVDEIKSLGSLYGIDVQTLTDETLIETEQIKQESIELSTGNYVVGEDITAGKYDIVGINRGSVYVKSKGKNYGDIVAETIKPQETTYSNIQLKDGYTVEIVLGGKIRLESK